MLVHSALDGTWLVLGHETDFRRSAEWEAEPGVRNSDS